jgi:outer membrane receptor protein involved in Fe transport
LTFHGFAGATVRHVSDRLSSFDVNPSQPQYHLPQYTTTDIRTGIEIEKTRVQLYVRNAFDSRGQLSADSTFAVVPGGPVEVSILQPRTIGVSLNTRF